MTTDRPAPTPETPSGAAEGTDTDARSLGRVTIATLIAAASGYLVLLLAARHLGAIGYGVFAVFWAAYGLVTGAQNGQLQETTRAVRAAADGGVRSRPLLVNLGIGVGLAALVAATSPLWSSEVFTDHRRLSVALLSVGVASFAVYAHLCGALSGMLSWSSFAVLLSVDALIRLAGAVVAVAAGWGTTAFLIITVIGSASWCLLLLGSSATRHAVGIGGDVAPRRLTTNTLTAMAAATASAVLVMGFPVLINLTANLRGTPDADEARVIGALILAVTLTRAPLLVPLNSFQGVLIARFVDRRDRRIAALAAPLGIVGVIGGVGIAAAWVVGPWLLRSIFGADFDLDGYVVALLTAGATCLALLTVTGAAAVAAGAHRWYAAGWWVATVVAVGMLLVPADVEIRTCVALVVGPLVGLCVHLVGVLRRPATSAP
ncbi:polysaccharide biosynthesis protein [Gordonia rubripertincta]|uniref:polysaccharide biosynthesis protein n=1 Tax=Gordonia rubripertincta TaxID=36822 RepID=UPI0015FC2E10|nr:polysaccharide biosynthesis protein [Gordonia rubripertincta]QMU22280.1 polysaccharide biosynthesis protein [Gordonia rubripertincta]